MIWKYLVSLFLFHVSYAIPQATLSKSSSGGLTFQMKDDQYSLVAIHFSINQELSGVAAGQHAADIKTPQGSMWTYTSSDVQMNRGDVVNYWILVIQNGEGKQLLNQHWTCCGETTTRTTKRTTKPTTRKPATVAQNVPLHTDGGSVNTGSGTNTGESVNTGGSVNTGPVNTGGNTNTGETGNTGGTTNTGGGSNTNFNMGAQHTSQVQCSSYPCLVFEDNFDTFNFDVWEHEISAAGGGNWEFQYYLNNRSNSYVKDGKLFIKPTLTSDKYGEPFLTSGDLDLWGFVANDVCTGNMFYGCKRHGDGTHIINPIQSARLRSIRGFSMKYGKLEVEAKLPTGDWIWPAIWLLPKWNRYGGWPASGEIDLCESRGNRQLVDSHGQSIGVNAMGSTLHFGTDFWNNGWKKAHADKILSSGTFADGFHKYVLEWDEDGIRTVVDGEEVLNVSPDDGGFWKIGEFEKLKLENPWRNSGSKIAPFDQEFYIILNVAVGGTGGYWEDNLNGMPWNNVGETALRDFWNARGAWYPTWNADKNDGEDAAMQINYIRYWKMKP